MPDSRDILKGSREHAREALRRLDEYRERIDLADVLAAEGKTFRAAATLSSALSLHAGDAETYSARATAYSILGDLDRALADVERALELHPAYVPALEAGSRIRFRLGDAPGALRDLDRAIDIHPTARLHLQRGAVRQSLADWPGAGSDYGRSIELDPSDPRAWAARGILRCLESDTSGAVRDLRTALEYISKDADRALVRTILRAIDRLAREGALDAHDHTSLKRRCTSDPEARRARTNPPRALPLERIHRPRASRKTPLALGALVSIALAAIAVWLSPNPETEPALALPHPRSAQSSPPPSRGDAPTVSRLLDEEPSPGDEIPSPSRTSDTSASESPVSWWTTGQVSQDELRSLVDLGLLTQAEANRYAEALGKPEGHRR